MRLKARSLLIEENHSRTELSPRPTPAHDDPRPRRFAFVSCQNENFGAQNAYHRMIYEDEQASEQDRLGSVLHLGDFIYELVWYPEDRAEYYDRKVRDIVRYPHREKFKTPNRESFLSQSAHVKQNTNH